MFDSGVGGISIYNAVHQNLPGEDVIYLADSKNAPYGERNFEDIINFGCKNTELLLDKGCKMIVVACNTATTIAIDHLRKRYPVPFVGIEPAIKPAALNSKTKSIGILATKGTLSSRLFHKTSDLFAKNIQVIEIIGSGLVERIEKGEQNAAETRRLLEKLLQPTLEKEIDYLVLGCSHYPYLIPVLRDILPEHVGIIDSGQAVARQVKSILTRENLLNTTGKSHQHFYINRRDTRILKSFVDNANAFTVDYLDF